MKTKLYALIPIIAFLSLASFGQVKESARCNYFTFDKYRSVTVSGIKNDWNVRLLNLDQMMEGNKEYNSYLQKIKKESAARFPRKDVTGGNTQFNPKGSLDTCTILSGFEGNVFANSVPNDNTMAISNNGMLISNINSTIYIFDTPNDTLLKKVSLVAFSDTLPVNSSQYDPKLLYDPEADKFVMVYLAGHKDSTSNIIVAFSETNDPTGVWNLYTLPGNPLADTSWSDFPAIALTHDELFITVNLLSDTGVWQTAFKQSIIWQIDKSTGYNGTTLSTRLWSDINFGGKPIRNTHPIQGGSGLQGPDIYLLSNRNFAIQCDTLFVLHISNVLTDTNATLTIEPRWTTHSYGAPPDAWQPGNKKMATNDARVLGGFIENDYIQFVGNTIDTLTGNATIYHGIFYLYTGSNIVNLTLMSDTVEFGYPNISYTGSGPLDNSAIISADFSGKFTYPSFCAFNYNYFTQQYSTRVIIKAGTSYVNLFGSGQTERWGDYSGSQRVYNDPGKVWVSGNFGKKVNTLTRGNGTWIAQLQKAAPDAGIGNIGYADHASSLSAYPNPVNDEMFAEVILPYDAGIKVALYDNNGRQVKLLWEGKATEGRNLLSFSTQPLSPGLYFVTVSDGNRIFLNQKLVKE